MTIAEAQAAAPDWKAFPRAAEFGVIQAEPQLIPWNGAPYNFRINFEQGRLLYVRARREFAASSEAECTQAFDALLSEMELQFGALDEAPHTNGAETVLRPSGSRVVHHQRDDGYQTLAAFKKNPEVNAGVIWRVPESGQPMTCTLFAGAWPDDALLAQIAPPAPLPDDIASAQPIDATLSDRADFSRFYPPRALDLELEGRVDLECLVLEKGALRCAVEREAPAGLGFGDAAMRIASTAQVPETYMGEATLGRRVRLKFPFRLS